MQIENVKEYELLRSDAESVKTCITQYVGFLLTGSSITLIATPLVGYYLLTESDVIAVPSLELFIAFSAYFLSMIT
jgi:hypothetical protein